MRPSSEEDDGNRAENDPEIKREGSAVDVLDVELNPILEALDGIPSRDLPEACQPGLHAESAAVRAFLDEIGLVVGKRSRPDDGHLPAEDVHKLGDLIEAGAPEKFPEGSDPGIPTDLEDRSLHLVFLEEIGVKLRGIHHHGSELEDREAFAPFTAADLPEDNGARGGQFDRHGDHQAGRGEKDESEQRACNVQEALDEPIPEASGGLTEDENTVFSRPLQGGGGRDAVEALRHKPDVDPLGLAGGGQIAGFRMVG